MKKILTKTTTDLYYLKDGVRVDGVHLKLSGNIKELRGDVTRISGDVSGISGNVSGLNGDVTRISGDVDACEITNEERERGVDIKDLIDKIRD